MFVFIYNIFIIIYITININKQTPAPLRRHVAAVICRENARMLGSTLDARSRARATHRSARPPRSPLTGSTADP